MRDFVLSILQILRDGMATTGLFLTYLTLIIFVANLYAYSPIWAAENWPAWSIVALLPVFIAVLGTALFWIFEERRRKRLFTFVMSDGLFGWLSPIIVVAYIFLFAVSVFSVGTFLLRDWNAVKLSAPSCEQCPVHVG